MSDWARAADRSGLRGILLLLYMQMLGTLTPIILFPHEVFAFIPYAPTLEGQYIIKNLVMISAGIVVGATVRGGWMVSEPSCFHASLKPLEFAHVVAEKLQSRGLPTK